MLLFPSMRGKTENAGSFLTVDEAADLVGLSHWTIRKYIHDAKLQRYKSASRTVVSRSELLELVKPEIRTATHRSAQGAANCTAAPLPTDRTERPTTSCNELARSQRSSRLASAGRSTRADQWCRGAQPPLIGRERTKKLEKRIL